MGGREGDIFCVNFILFFAPFSGRLGTGEIIFGGAYIWRGLFFEFYGMFYVKLLLFSCLEQAVKTEEKT